MGSGSSKQLNTYQYNELSTKDGFSKKNTGGITYAFSNNNSFGSSFGFCDSANANNEENTHKSQQKGFNPKSSFSSVNNISSVTTLNSPSPCKKISMRCELSKFCLEDLHVAFEEDSFETEVIN
jgi:hypothetical protein